MEIDSSNSISLFFDVLAFHLQGDCFYQESAFKHAKRYISSEVG